MTEISMVESQSQQDSTLSSLIRATDSIQTLSLPFDLDEPDSSSNNYLLSLTSKSLNDLRELPAILNQSKVSLDTQLSSLCSQHVTSFVQIHQATSSLPTLLSNLDNTLQAIIDRDLPALSEAAQQFTQRVESPLKVRDKAQNLLTEYETSLKDIMDIPRLLMTCVRASHPVEALQLAVHMMKINSGNKHGNTIRSLQEECQIHLQKLREDLLRGLGARGLRLPAAKRLVSLLRKFRDVDNSRSDNYAEESYEKIGISDSYICLSFLHSRWAILEELASNSNAPKSSSIISSQLAIWRDTVGDTCGIAQALFPTSSKMDTEDELAPSTLISSFSRQSLTLLQQLLANSLPGLPENSINLQDSFETFAAIHTQLSYSAASLSRQGVDISRIVSGHTILHQQVVALWKNAMTNAKEELDKARIGKDSANCLTWFNGTIANTLIQEPLQIFLSSNVLSIRLAQFPDIRLFVNGILKSYNALLSFAPIISGVEILASLDSVLYEVVEEIFDSVKAKEQIEIELILEPIVSSSAGSSYYERDAARLGEANVALLARMLLFFCDPICTYLRDLIRDLFCLKGRSAKPNESFQTLSEELKKWGSKADAEWLDGEKVRQDRVREEEEKLVAEEAQRREEEREKAEEERKKAAEMKKREEEEAEKQRILKAKEEEEERQRIQKKKEDEAERQRIIKIEEEKVALEKDRLRKIREEEEEKKKRATRLQEEQAEKKRLKREKEEEEKKRVEKLRAKEEEQQQGLAKETEEEESRQAEMKQINAEFEEEKTERIRQQQEEAEEKDRSLKAKEADEEIKWLRQAVAVNEEADSLKEELGEKASEETLRKAHKEADKTLMDVELHDQVMVHSKESRKSAQSEGIEADSKGEYKAKKDADNLRVIEPSRKSTEIEIAIAESGAAVDPPNTDKPPFALPDTAIKVTTEIGSEKKIDSKPANRLAEKLRQKQEQRQRKVEGSNQA